MGLFIMQISDLSLNELTTVILREFSSERRSGSDIVKLFNYLGFSDDYWELNKKGEFGSRRDFTNKKLAEINGTFKLISLIEILVDDRQTQNPDEIACELNKILKHDGLLLYKNENEIYKIGGKSIQEDLQLKPVFEKIEKEIIEHIKTSKYSVWVAVAWITSKPIAEALYRQHQKGGNIRIIVNDDSLTESKGIRFEKSEIEYYKVSPKNGNFNNLMHHKFCVIDFKKVITGSFNWTVKASFNNENITVIEQKDQAEKYADEFIKLIKDLPRR